MQANRQRTLPFPESKEDTRLATIERLFGTDKRVSTAARFFDYDEATQAARSATPPVNACIEEGKHCGAARIALSTIDGS